MGIQTPPQTVAARAAAYSGEPPELQMQGLNALQRGAESPAQAGSSREPAHVQAPPVLPQSSRASLNDSPVSAIAPGRRMSALQASMASVAPQGQMCERHCIVDYQDVFIRYIHTPPLRICERNADM